MQAFLLVLAVEVCLHDSSRVVAVFVNSDGAGEFQGRGRNQQARFDGAAA